MTRSPFDYPEVATPPLYRPPAAPESLSVVYCGPYSMVPVFCGSREPLGVGGSRYPRSSDVSGCTITPRWMCAAYYYPDGSCEGSLTPVPPEPTNGADRVRAHRARQAERRGESVVAVTDDEIAIRRRLNLERAGQRAKVSVRRRVRAHGLRRLLTFTNGSACGGWDCRRAALDDVARFLKHHGVRCFGAVPIVLVAERGGKGGRWHVHAAMPKTGRLDYSRIIRRWSAFMTSRGWKSSAASGLHRFHAGDEHGKHSTGFSSARSCARYLVKYLVKSLEIQPGESGEHRYRSWNAGLPVAWRVLSHGLGSVAAVIGLMECDLHARFAPIYDYTGAVVAERFRCYTFDLDGLLRPIDLPNGSVLFDCF